MKRCPGNGIEGAMVCTSCCALRPLFYFLDDFSYPQSVQTTEFEKNILCVYRYLNFRQPLSRLRRPISS